MDAHRVAFNTWQEKTEWVQKDKRFDVLLPWGKHRADVMKEYIDHLETRCAALAAENAGLKAAHPQPFGPEMMKALDAYEKHQDETPETGMLDAFFILRDSIRVDTTATDAFLAEVRAQGVDAAIEELNQLAERSEKEVPIAAEHHRSAALYLQLLSAQLRKGVRS